MGSRSPDSRLQPWWVVMTKEICNRPVLYASHAGPSSRKRLTSKGGEFTCNKFLSHVEKIFCGKVRLRLCGGLCFTSEARSESHCRDDFL